MIVHENVIVKNGQNYNQKSFIKVKDTPKVVLSTASGKVELKEK